MASPWLISWQKNTTFWFTWREAGVPWLVRYYQQPKALSHAVFPSTIDRSEMPSVRPFYRNYQQSIDDSILVSLQQPCLPGLTRSAKTDGPLAYSEEEKIKAVASATLLVLMYSDFEIYWALLINFSFFPAVVFRSALEQFLGHVCKVIVTVKKRYAL